MGRPLKFDSVEDLQVRINQYFDDCDKHEDTRKWEHDEIEIEQQTGKKVCTNCWQPERSKGCMLISGHLKLPRPYTVTGLALWLDTTRRTLLDYEAKAEFSHTVQAAKQRIENYAEEKLYDRSYPTRGVIFSLSNNADGWSERKTTDVNIGSDGAKELGARLFDDAKSASPNADAGPAPSDAPAAAAAE